jgi:hypothetical protein
VVALPQKYKEHIFACSAFGPAPVKCFRAKHLHAILFKMLARLICGNSQKKPGGWLPDLAPQHASEELEG